MSIDQTINFPTSIWDGLSDNPARTSRGNNQEPDYRDWDQMVGEVLAMQLKTIRLRQILTFDLVASTLTTGTDKANWLYVPNNMTITGIVAMVKTAPTAATLITDVMKDATGDGATFTTIFSTTGNRPIVATSTKVSPVAVPDTVNLVAGEILRLDIIQIGSSVAGSNLTVSIIGYAR